MPQKKYALYFLAFLLIFLLSMDFWSWHASKPLIWGIPYWVVFLYTLTLMISVFYYLFSKKFWRD